MRELRLSIPFVGGVTVVYTKEEVDAKVARVKTVAASSVDSMRRGTQHVVKGLASNLGRLADKLDSK